MACQSPQRHLSVANLHSLGLYNHSVRHKIPRWNESLLTLLGQEQGESALQRNTLARPLVVGREARRVRRLGDLAVGDLFEGVEAGAAGVEGVHQMHGGRLFSRIWNEAVVENEWR